MFRITEDPSSGSLVQYLAKNYKNDFVIFSEALYKAPWWSILCDPKHVEALLNIS